MTYIPNDPDLLEKERKDNEIFFAYCADLSRTNKRWVPTSDKATERVAN